MTTLRGAMLVLLPVIVIAVGLVWTTPIANAKNSVPGDPGFPSPAQQPDPTQSASEAKTFIGEIVKDGDRVVLRDAGGTMTYQLDDQQNATAFLNQSVAVTGILDSASGVIQVDAIKLVS